MQTRRKTDKIELIWKIGSFLGIALLLYVILPMKTDLIKQIDEVKQIQKELNQKIFDNYTECKDDVNKVRQDYQQDMRQAVDKMMDKIYAVFEKGRKDNS